MQRLLSLAVVPIYLLLSLLSINNSFATQLNTNTKNNTSNLKSTSLVVNAEKGIVLYSCNADQLRHPASLTKMMTLYLTFEAIKAGKLRLNDKLGVSNYAASRPKSNLGLRAGEKILVQDAILAAIIKSANDAVVVLAEAISKDEKIFALKMTKRAQDLGMSKTIFRNSSGLHHPEQVSTAYDMAKLAIALYRDFPEHYHLFSRTSFLFKGKTYKGHNNVLNNYKGATGLKTGFINASGYNLVTSATRGSTKLVGVVMGEETARSRDIKMANLLDKHFNVVSSRLQDINLEEFIDVINYEAPVQKKIKLKTLNYAVSSNNKVKLAHNTNKIKRNKRYARYYTNIAMNTSNKISSAKLKKTKRANDKNI
ncbi:MAG: D-alanyl-D-alanine carboxypeptidase family protein [Rickettsiales endosymbiont of Dermacentor nuttalli]